MHSLKFHPIGVIRTPHTAKQDTPVQPHAARDVEGEIEIYPKYREALADLKGFERIWLLFWCHQTKPYKLKVIPHREVVYRGLFATRAPGRPNPIGISAVRLLGVDEAAGLLKVADVDMLNGTPLLDIKPYVPSMDSHPEARAGWLDDIRAGRDSDDSRFSGGDS